MSQQKTPDAIPRTASDRQEPRESVWSVRRKHADTFFATLFTLWIAVAVIVSLIYLNDHSRPAGMGTTEWTRVPRWTFCSNWASPRYRSS